MSESRRRTKSGNVPPKAQAQPKPTDDEVDSTPGRVSDAPTDSPAAERDKPSQPAAPEDAAGANGEIDTTTIPEKTSEAGGFSDQVCSDAFADLLHNREFVDQLVVAMITNGKSAERLICWVSEKVQDCIKNDPHFSRKLLACATANPSFRGKVVEALAKSMR